MKLVEEVYNFFYDVCWKNWENFLVVLYNLILEYGGVLCFCFDYNCFVISYESEIMVNIMGMLI